MKASPFRCTRCVLPETTPGIEFDRDGVCNYCRSYEPFACRGEASLVTLLNAHRKSGKKYECIVNVSGGRDSAFTLLKLVKDYHMKVLALNYENPYTDAQARQNITNMVRALKVDLIRFRFMSGIHESCFCNNLRAWSRNPSPAMVPMMCIGCKIIWKKILEIARRHEIGLIVNGGNPYEYTSFKKELLGLAASSGLGESYARNVFGLAREAAKNLRYLKPQFVPALIKGYLFANQYAIGSKMLGRSVEQIDLFHYLEWNEQEILRRITGELGWDYPRGFGSTWRFDCTIGHLKDYLYLKTIGLTEKDDFYAQMVRAGVMTREEALHRLDVENRLHAETVRHLFMTAGLSCQAAAIQ